MTLCILFRYKFLYLKVPPDEPRIFDTHGKEITTIAGPFREGQEFFLSCQVSGGNPPPKVSWWRTDVELPGTTHQSILTGAIINNILMRAVPRDFYATKLICRAQGSQLIDPVEKEVTIQLHCELYYIFYFNVAIFGWFCYSGEKIYFYVF